MHRSIPLLLLVLLTLVDAAMILFRINYLGHTKSNGSCTFLNNVESHLFLFSVLFDHH